MNLRRVLILAALGSAAAAQAADWAVTVQGPGPYYKLALPMAAYALTQENGPGDLRIRNAAGQAIPFAWTRADEQRVAATRTQQVPLFPLPATAAASEASDDLAPAFVILPNGSLRAVQKNPADAGHSNWLLDTRHIKGRLLQAVFEMPAHVTGVFAYQLEASDDLKNWRKLGGTEQLLRLQHQGQTLERLSVELGGAQARFVRLRWLNPQQGAPITRVSIDSANDDAAPPALQWTEALAPTQCGDDYCDYAAPAGAPISSMKLQLGQANTLAPVRLYGIDDRPAATRERHRMHNPLYALRHAHRAKAPEGSAREVYLTDGLAYRLGYPEGELNSEALPLNGTAWKTLRLRTTGPISALGATPPRLSLAVPLRSLVFLGQGERPYALSVADRSDARKAAIGAPLAIQALVPNYKPDMLANLEQGSVAVPNVAVQATPASAPLAAASAPNKRVWLWAALVAGFLLLAGMAWSLFSGLQKGKNEA